MVRSLHAIALLFVLAAVAAVISFTELPAAGAQPDPFAEGSGGAAPGSGAASPPAVSAAPVEPGPSPSAAPTACDYITQSTCGAQNTGLLSKSGAYVFVAVLLFSLLRVWWDRRGTNTAGVRFVATLLAAAGTAGTLAYLDPARGQDLECCLASAVYQGQILFQDSALARAAVLGFVPAAVAFVLVAVIHRMMKG
jgi:hypothetical protein